MTPAARGPHIRLTLGQTMVLVMIAALCLGPLVLAIKTQNGVRVLGAVIFDIVLMPLLATVVLLLLVEQSATRDWLLKAFWLTPLAFFGLVLTFSVPIIILGAFFVP